MVLLLLPELLRIWNSSSLMEGCNNEKQCCDNTKNDRQSMGSVNGHCERKRLSNLGRCSWPELIFQSRRAVRAEAVPRYVSHQPWLLSNFIPCNSAMRSRNAHLLSILSVSTLLLDSSRQDSSISAHRTNITGRVLRNVDRTKAKTSSCLRTPCVVQVLHCNAS